MPVALQTLKDDLYVIQKLDDQPNDIGGLTAEQLKLKFDEAPNKIKNYINNTLIPAISDTVAEAEQRATAEAERVSNETARQSAETARVSAESARASAETSRVSAETARATAESARAAAETARANENTGIVAQATERAQAAAASASAARAQAEAAASSASTATTKASAASASASTAASMASEASTYATTATNQANAASTSASNAATSATAAQAFAANASEAKAAAESAASALTVWETYSATKTYQPLNKVVYDGSSYCCIRQSTGNLPTNTTYWLLIAQKGQGGTGSGDMTKAVYDPQNKAQDVFAYADQKLPKAGGTMTGALTLSGAPTADLHAATKKYVDSAAAQASIPVIHASSTDGVTYTAVFDGITEIMAGMMVVMIPNMDSTSRNAKLNINSLGDMSINRGKSGTSQTTNGGNADYIRANFPLLLVCSNVNPTVYSWVIQSMTQPSATDLSGTIPVAQGGTGRSTFTSGALIGDGTNAIGVRGIIDNTSTSGSISAVNNLITARTLRYAINRTSSVAAADTSYTTYMARGTTLNSAETTPTANGTIAWTYE